MSDASGGQFWSWAGPTVAGLGVVIAYLNWKLKQQEHKFRLYEKRMEVYDALGEYLKYIEREEDDAAQDDVIFFQREIDPAIITRGSLLFPEKIKSLIQAFEEALDKIYLNPITPRQTEYIENVRKKGMALTIEMENVIAVDEGLCPKWLLKLFKNLRGKA